MQLDESKGGGEAQSNETKGMAQHRYIGAINNEV